MPEDHGWSAPLSDDGPQRPVPPQPPDGPSFASPAPADPGTSGWARQPPAGPPAGGAQGWGAPVSWQPMAIRGPGIIPLRPLSLGEIMDGAFQALRTNPRSMIGISAVLLAVLSVLTIPIQAAILVRMPSDSEMADPDADLTNGDLAAMLIGWAVPGILQMIAVLVLNGLLVLAVSDAVLGRRTPLADLWSRVGGRIGAIIGISLLTSLTVAAVFVAFLLPGFLLIAFDAVALGVLLLVLGALAAIIVALLMWARWSLAAPALLLERRRAVESLRRSWNLVSGSGWRVLGIMILAQIIAGIGSALLAMPFSLGSEAVRSASDDLDYAHSLLSVLISSIGETAAGAVFFPFGAAVTALLYTDLRMRKEGLDVELIRAAQGGAAS